MLCLLLLFTSSNFSYYMLSVFILFNGIQEEIVYYNHAQYECYELSIQMVEAILGSRDEKTAGKSQNLAQIRKSRDLWVLM